MHYGECDVILFGCNNGGCHRPFKCRDDMFAADVIVLSLPLRQPFSDFRFSAEFSCFSDALEG